VVGPAEPEGSPLPGEQTGSGLCSCATTWPDDAEHLARRRQTMAPA